jgi:hypothetical protein
MKTIIRWTREHAATLCFIAVAAVGVWGIWRLEVEIHDRTTSDCVERQESRDAVRNIFLFLISLAPNQNSQGVVAIKTYIDTNLPAIVCPRDHIVVVPSDVPSTVGVTSAPPSS